MNLLIELGCIVLVVLMAVYHASVDISRLYAAFAALLLLVLISAIGRLRSRAAALDRVLVAFLYLFIYVSAREGSFAIALAGDRVLEISIADLVLFAVGVAFGARLITAARTGTNAGIGRSAGSILLYSASIAGMICCALLCLHLVLMRTYAMDTRIILGNIHNALGGALLFSVIMIYVNTNRSIARFALYAGIGMAIVAVLRVL